MLRPAKKTLAFYQCRPQQTSRWFSLAAMKPMEAFPSIVPHPCASPFYFLRFSISGSWPERWAFLLSTCISLHIYSLLFSFCAILSLVFAWFQFFFFFNFFWNRRFWCYSSTDISYSRNAIVTISWYFIERTLPCGLCYFCYNHHYVVIVGCLIGVLRRRNFSFALMQKGCLQLLSDFTFVRQSFQITKHSNMSSKNPSFLQIVKLPPKSTHESLN